MPNTAPPAAAPQPAENLPAQRGTFHFGEPGTESQSPILKGHDVAYFPSPKIITLTHPIHLELVRVSAGEFLMGSNPAIDKNAQKDEQPQHRVYVSEFFIGRYPITNEQYAIFVRATKQRPPPHLEKGRISPGKENHPVVYISVDEALTFCDWLSQESGRTFRLPTEAEWEKAARGTDGRIYPWGNKWDKAKLNSGDGGPGTTTSVSHYSPDGDSPYGAADMCGNVWEWCADWYSDMEYQRRAKTVTKDPLGSEKESIRVLRGGAFLYKASWARCAARYANEGYVGYRSNGLRVVGTAASFLEH
jgi:formylglycine-generating enzyme required for sulfatase activity